MRLVFMGTPDFSVPVLQAMVDNGHDVVCAYSQPPRRAGRGMAERKSPVHQFAEERGIAIRTPMSLKGPEEQAALLELDADAAIVVAYGLLLPKPVLGAPRLGCFNVHASLLPRWRGAAPIQRAIMAGDAETGISIMKMDEGLDTGDVCLERRLSIGPHMTAAELHDALSELGATAMADALEALGAGTLICTPQSEVGVTYAAKIDKAESRIDFKMASEEVHNHIRGLSPFPGAWFELPGKKPERIKVLRSAMAEGDGTPGTILDDKLTVACGSCAIRLLEVQRAGKGAMASEDFLRGTTVPPGQVLA